MAHRRTVILSIGILIACALLISNTSARNALAHKIRNAQESLVFAVAPTASRAFEYADRHFDASGRASFNIDRAETYYLHALRLDPHMPYVRHQLARIAFLRGDFPRALYFIKSEIALSESGPASTSSWYMSGLIRGFMGDFDGAEADYRTFLKTDPLSWAGNVDLSWVLLRAGKYEATLAQLDPLLEFWPENPWIHNMRAIALFELGRHDEALEAVYYAQQYVAELSEEEWIESYPGNDPKIAPDGIAHFQKSVEDNMHRILLALENSEK